MRKSSRHVHLLLPLGDVGEHRPQALVLNGHRLIDLPKGQAERAVHLVFEDIVKALRNGDKVNISGFGTFAVSERKARTGRNPKTGALVPVHAKRVPFFKVGKELRLRVDGKPWTPEDAQAME